MKDHRIAFRVSPTLYKALEEKRERDNINISAWVRSLIEQALANDSQQKGEINHNGDANV